MNIIKEEKENVVHLIFNRPEKKNALSLEMMEELIFHLNALSDHVRVVVLEGKGSYFCSGMDLDDLERHGEKCFQIMAEVFQTIYALPVVTLTRIRGGALAGGLGLIAASDLAFANSDALFSLPEMRRGLIPVLVLELLKQQCPIRSLNELIFTGEPISAAKAAEISLINAHFSGKDLEHHCLHTISNIIKSGPHAIQTYKRSRNKIDFSLALKAHHNLLQNEEHEEGVRAFIEKRPPHWMN